MLLDVIKYEYQYNVYLKLIIIILALFLAKAVNDTLTGPRRPVYNCIIYFVIIYSYFVAYIILAIALTML